MKKILCVFAYFYVCAFVNAQYNPHTPWMQELAKKKGNYSSKGVEAEYTFKEITDAFDNYWKDKNKNEKGNGYKVFMRWRSYWENNLLPNGKIPNGKYFMNILQQKEAVPKGINSKSRGATSNIWEPMGPFKFEESHVFSSSTGIGRINCVLPDPNNEQILYVGAPSGGLWKSKDYGNSWSSLTDKLGQIGVSAIAIDPRNSNIIYIATGDDDRNASQSVGIYRTENGGTNWKYIGLVDKRGGEIYIDPTNPDKIWVSTDNGLHSKTITQQNKYNDTGWVEELPGNITGFRFKQSNNSNIKFVTSDGKFYRYNESLNKFEHITNGIEKSLYRSVIGVSKANSAYVYILTSDRKLYLSTDGGTSFKLRNKGKNMLPGDQLGSDLAITVSGKNANIVFVGSLIVKKSTNAGESFTYANKLSSRTYKTKSKTVHVDVHFLRYFNGKIFQGNDGGLYISENDGETFDVKNRGLQISQFYKIALSENSDSNRIVGGTQDNGGFSFDGTDWHYYHGGDGMDAAILTKAPSVIFGFGQYGDGPTPSLYSGKSNLPQLIRPNKGTWVTPLVVSKDDVLYAGFKQLYKIDANNLNNLKYEKVSDYEGFNSNLSLIELDPIDSKIIYTSIGSKLFKSNKEGKGSNWEKIYTFSSPITSIEVNNNNNSIVYVTTGGTNGKVLESNDGGNSFKDITAGLPNIGKQSVKHHKDTDDLYIGTYLGVYYKHKNQPWQDYSYNLPNASVRDIEINSKDQKIVVATYGRGIWRAPLLGKIDNSNDSQSPSTPKNLKVEADELLHNSVKLLWDASTDNEKVIAYDIYQDNKFIQFTENTNIVVKGLQPATEYSFKVKARDTARNESSFSNTVKVKTLLDTEAPSVPKGHRILGNQTKSTSIAFRWDFSIDNVAVKEYEVFDKDENYILTTEKNIVTITNLEPNTNYSFKVRAVDFSGNKSAFTSLKSETTKPLEDIIAPTKPSGFNLNRLGSTSADITWTNSTDDNNILYEVYLGGEFTTSITPNDVYLSGIFLGQSNENFFTVRNLTPNTTYIIRVRAKDEANNISDFNSFSFTTKDLETIKPSVPELLEITSTKDSEVILNWNKATDNDIVAAYEIFINDQFTLSTEKYENVSIKNLLPETNYKFKVRAKDGNGNLSNFSNEVMTKTLSDITPPAPVSFIYQNGNVTETSISIAWISSMDNVGVVGYDVYVNDQKLLSTRETNAVLTNLNPNTSYTFNVTAQDAAGNISELQFFSALTIKTVGESVLLPSIVLQSRNITSNSAELYWTQWSDNPSVEYGVYLDNELLHIVSADITAVVIKNLNPNTTYHTSVIAKDESLNLSNDEMTIKTEGICFGVEEYDIEKRRNGGYNVGDKVTFFNTHLSKTQLYEKVTPDFTGWKLVGICDDQSSTASNRGQTDLVSLPLLNKLTVAPNPIKGNVLYIRLPSNITNPKKASYQIISNFGTVAQEGSYSNAINVSKLSAGSYFIRVQLSSGKTLTERFIKSDK